MSRPFRLPANLTLTPASVSGRLETVEVDGQVLGYIKREIDDPPTFAARTSGETVGRFTGPDARDRAIRRLYDFKRAEHFTTMCIAEPEKARQL